MKDKFDLVVLGGGPGGYVAAIRAAQLGLQVAVVEEREMGGTCLNRGCIPTKALLHAAELYHTVKTCAEFGIETDGVSFDYAKIAGKKDRVVKQLRAGVDALVKSNGVEIVRGRGVIKDRHTIAVSAQQGQTLRTEKIIIATGSRPLKPPLPGLDGPRVFDSDGVLNLTACPAQPLIIGGGVIGVELATIFSSLGKEVTIIEMMDALLPGIDAEVSALLGQTLERRGVKIHTGSRVRSVQGEERVVCTFEKGGKELQASGDMVIVAVGRRPNSENIGLEQVGIRTEKGFIKVNARLETPVEGIYAVGDVTGKVMLAHVASAQGLIAAANAAGQSCTIDYGTVPSCIYTTPEIAAAGLTEAEAAARGYKIKTGKFPLSANGKSVLMDAKEGFAKIIADSETGEILGAHIISPRATELIGEICVAMKLESTIAEVASAMHPHPTVSEIIMEAAHDVEKMCVHKMPGK